MEEKEQVPSTPLRNPPSSLLLRDISNFKTPRQQHRNSQTNPNFNFESPCPQFFTALKQTPKSSPSTVRRRPRYSLAAQRLKAVELEQSKSSRKTQTSKEKSLRSLAKSLTVWLNFLLENPRSCGVDVSRFTGEDWSNGSSVVFSSGKRDSVSHSGVGVDRQWRGPKRRKDMSWVDKGEAENTFTNSIYSRLQVSLGDVCSLDDLKERMVAYLTLSSCKEIFDVMTLVTKNIDEGRLKMKAHCPIVTDVGLKENALRILMCYNPIWLRIGLYIIFGGELLLPELNADTNSEQEVAFLKMVVEKLFFSHAGLAKAYVYNKLVDGIYRPGYYEKLGCVMLKRFLLLALVLDKAKSQSSLPISHGIDGLDGGSPLLFTSRSNIKASREMICDFLSPDVMHGVGNILAQLVILGYKVSYHQNPLVEYVFKVTNLFNDLQDGVLLCRTIHLLQHDSSILKKIVVPSDDRKKNLVNCGISLKYLKQAGVSLYDEDGIEIMSEDIVNGDKELIISLLWNMFVHLQVPLLVNHKLVSDEITKIRGPCKILAKTSSHLEMLLEWIQAICENYDLKVENFASLVDGKAMWCLLDYYFRKEHCHANSNKDLNGTKGEVSIMSTSDYLDAVHNFILSQRLTTLLGNFPEVLQVSDLLEYKGACSDQGVVILLVFLSSQLVMKRNMEQLNFRKLLGYNQTSERKCIRKDRLDANHEEALTIETCQHDSKDNVRNFKAIMAWWKEMAQNNSKSDVKPVYPAFQSFPRAQSSDNQRENAAIIIQSHFRRSVECHNYTRVRNAVYLLQDVIRAWLMVKKTPTIKNLNTIKVQEPFDERKTLSKKLSPHMVFIAERHTFIKLKHSIVIIQRAIRSWIAQKHQKGKKSISDIPNNDVEDAAIIIQKHIRRVAENKMNNFQEMATLRIQAATIIRAHYCGYMLRKIFVNQKLAAKKIQNLYRGWVLRKSFIEKKKAVTKLQRFYRGLRCLRNFEHQKLAIRSAVMIQSYARGWIARRVAYRRRCFIVLIQSVFRGWLMRREFLLQKEAATMIQNAFRCVKCSKAFDSYRHAAIEIQRVLRGHISRKKLLGASCLREGVIGHNDGVLEVCFQSRELKVYLHSVLKLQRWWRGQLLAKTRTMAAIVVQSHVRGWIARQTTAQQRHHIVLIQSLCRRSIMRRKFLLQKEAVTRIQAAVKRIKWCKAFEIQRIEKAIVVQSHVRGWIARQTAAQRRHHIVLIQSFSRGWLMRREFLLQKEAAMTIQNAFRCVKCSKAFDSYRHASIEIQRFVRGSNTRKKLLGASCIRVEASIGEASWDGFQSRELKIYLCSVLKLQKLWRGILLKKRRTKAAIIVQSHVRGWIARRITAQRKHNIVLIQSYWKGYIERKHSSGKLLEIRWRMQKSSANVDDSMRLINRLIAALLELKSMKSVSGILHTCATLDMATKHSKICCEKLVEAGAIDTLLGLIRSVSRSIPDQEVLRYTLSTLGNLTRHPHLTEALIDTRDSCQIILWEFIRSKDEAFFIEAKLLRKICSSKKGVERLCNLNALVKRLRNHVEDLRRKAGNEKRNPRNIVTKEQTDRRLREAVEILNLITNG